MKHGMILLFALNTLILLYPLIVQFLIIAKAPEDDPRIWSKVFFFVFTFCLLAANWLCYLKVTGAAWFFFLICAIIAAWTYKLKNSINK